MGRRRSRAGLVALLTLLSLAGAPGSGAGTGPVLVRQPYLQLGTATSVVIRWRTDVDVDATVIYGPAAELPGGPSQPPAPGSLTLSAGDPTPGTDHEVALTGLSPNTRYYYAVGHGTGASFVPLAGNDAGHFFDTAPLAGQPKPTRLWVLGDSGQGNSIVLDVRDRYYEMAEADARHTELWLMLGDNAYPSGTDAQHQTNLFDVFEEMLRKSVLWPTIGNHDSFDGADGTWPYFDIFTLPTGGEAGGEPSGHEEYYSFDYANIHFVSLDSATYLIGGLPVSDMLPWLEADLLDTTQEWIVVFFHHPPYSKGAHDSDDPADSNGRLVDMRTLVVPILEDHGVDLVLSGHSHSYERSYLIHGHHGDSWSFDPAVHLIDGGDGDPVGDGAYQAEGVGAVFGVAGNASSLSPGQSEELNGPVGGLPHPAMVRSLYLNGSVVLDVNGNRLDGIMLDTTGAVVDHFTLIKGVLPQVPVADFGADPLTSLLPATVQFTDLSQNDPTQWGWDFNDDAIADSAEPNPQHTYSVPGSFSVRLKVSNSEGSDEIVKTGLICVTDGPPGAISGLSLQADKKTLTWDPHPKATAYDVATGDLGNLRASGGDYGAISECLAQVTPPQATDEALPGQGQARFYLVRGVNCLPETGTYDTFAEGQNAPRDLPLQGGGVGCACPVGDDDDTDGYCNAFDNCPATPGQSQQDLDQDGQGDICDPCPNDPLNDADTDGLCADVDNCPATPNPQQVDTDGDALGDLCDPDDDNDGVADDDDSSPLDPFVCRDADEDGCDDCVSGTDDPAADGIDVDGDGLCDLFDFCIDVDGDGLGNGTQGNVDCANPTTDSDDADPKTCADVDGDGCDDCSVSDWDPDNDGVDSDHDGFCDSGDNCPTASNANQADADLDGLGDVCDPCTDTDGDGAGNPGFPQNSCPLDNCPTVPNPLQEDVDGDLVGDLCDFCPLDPLNDADFDLICGDVDNCPATPNTNQADADADGTGDACDPCTDSDGDGHGDPGFPQNACPTDNCPDVPNPFQGDVDGDQLGDICDPCPFDPANDADGDSLCADADNCPATSNPDQSDFDGDSLGDACDTDDDNDGVPDGDDCLPLSTGVAGAPGPIGDTVRLDREGVSHIRWLRSFQGHTGNVYSVERAQPAGGDPGDMACLVGESPAPSVELPGGPAPGSIVFYLVAARNACGENDLASVPLTCGTADNDSDTDGIADLADNCPLLANPEQQDLDGDFVGNRCDNCPKTFNPDQADADADSAGDACDPI